MRNHRILSLMTAGILCISALSGCGSDPTVRQTEETKENYQVATEATKFTAYPSGKTDPVTFKDVEVDVNAFALRSHELPLLGVSLIIFIVTVAVYFVANYVSEGIAKQGELSGWEYIYTDKAGVLPDADLRVFSAQNPIVTESSVRRDNIYFVKTL